MKYALIVTILVLCTGIISDQSASAQLKDSAPLHTQQAKRSRGKSTASARRTYSSAGTYLIITHHDPDKCLLTMDKLQAADSTWLEHSWFGCISGDHTVYTVVDATSEEDALQKVPAMYRDHCKLVKVSKISEGLLEEMHSDYRDQKM